MEDCYHKRIDKYSAEYELINLEIADRADSAYKYHIGGAVVETQEHKDDTEIWTLKFPYGGTVLHNLRYCSCKDTIKKVLRNMDNVMEGLILFHHSDLYHCDVKSSNILYDKDYHVRLIDFGTAQQLPITEVDPVYTNIYTIWPFETHMVSGSNDDIFSNYVFGEYIDEPYFQTVRSFHRLDVSELNSNIINLRRHFYGEPVELHKEIVRRMDVYGLGISLSHILSSSYVRTALSESCYRQLKQIVRKMIEPYTLKRIDLPDALTEWRAVWTNIA